MDINTLIKIRSAEKCDIDRYFQWANELSTRKNSIHSNTIDIKIHQTWFNQKLQDERCYLYVGQVDTVAVGQVRFELFDDVAEVSFSIDVEFRGKGIGREILKTAIIEFSHACPRIRYIQAIVKSDNVASNRIFSRLGFSLHECNKNTGLNMYRIEISEIIQK